MDATLQSIFTQVAETVSETVKSASTVLKPKHRDNTYNGRFENERRRTGYVYSTRFILREPRMSWVNQWEFEEIGHRCRVLLHDCYDFHIVFALKPDEFTTVTANFRNAVELNTKSRQWQWQFVEAGSGEAYVRYNDNMMLGIASLSTAGFAGALLRYGTESLNVYARASTALESTNLRALIGATFRNDYVTLQADIDAVDPDSGFNGMGVLNINDAIKLGVRSRVVGHPTTHQPMRTVHFKASLSGESLDPKYNQPQDYELAVSALSNGSMLTATYLQNMMVPLNGVMHRFTMGGEFAHTQPITEPPVSRPGQSRAVRPRSYGNRALHTSAATNTLAVGVAWQPLDNVLLKCKGDVQA